MNRPHNEYRILVVNPGSTTTKVSLFDGTDETLSSLIRHTAEELSGFRNTMAQADFRENTVRAFLADNQTNPRELSAVIGRGGLTRPIESGVYAVNDRMVTDLSSGSFGEHASNLGAIIASRIASDAGCSAFIADSVVVDEMDEIARLSGIPEIRRKSIFHALNQKSSAREVASRRGRRYEELNLIVAHIGGGVSVGAHRKGRVVDVNNALDGDGPFAPERSGGIPVGQLVDLCFGGKFDRAQLRRRLTGGGGLVAYCGTNDLMEIVSRMDAGDRNAGLAFHAMAYQVSKEIAMHGATLFGSVDAIVLTGGMANNQRFVDAISERVSYLAPVEVIPGEREMISLARAAVSVLSGETEARTY